MTENQVRDENREGDAPERPPLRAAFLVWPGKVHSQTWMLFWVGVLYLIGALLPWAGQNARELLVQSDAGVSTMRVVQYQNQLKSHGIAPASVPHPGSVVAVYDAGMSFIQVLLLVCSLSMVVMGAISIWNRRLALTPTLCTWFLALAALYFFKGWPTPPYPVKPEQFEPVSNGFSHFGSTIGAIFGDFGNFFSGRAGLEIQAAFDGAGLGFYVTMLAQIGLTLIIVLSFFSGGKSTPAPGPRKRR